jgi:hypothetical protein
MGISDLFVSYN